MLRTTRYLSTCYLLCQAAAAWPGELRLENGAVLPGELVRIDAKSLVWQADKIGQVTVDKSDVILMHTTSPTPVAAGSGNTVLTNCQVDVVAGLWSIDCSENKLDEVALTDIHSVEPDTKSTGKVSLSLDLDRGANASDEIEGDLQARWLRPGYRHNVNFSIDYEQSGHDTTDDESDLNYQFDWLRTQGWYWYGRTRFYRNELESIKEVYAAGVGAGREYAPREDLSLTYQGGPALTYYFIDDRDGELEPAVLLSWTATWKTPWHNIEFSHSGDYAWIVTVDDGYRFQCKTGLTLPLYKNLVAQMRLDYDRTGIQIDSDGNEDIEWVFALGYRW